MAACIRVDRGAQMRSGQKKTTSTRLVVRNVCGEPAG